MNNDKVAVVILNTVPSLTDNHIWILETTDNVVPGLDSLLTYPQSKHATLTALQNAITTDNILYNEVSDIQIEISNIEITNPQNVSKSPSFHTGHTDFMYQRNTTNNDNRRSYSIQQNYFTYQRKGNHEWQIQASNTIVADLQNQINNLSSGGGSGSGGGGETGVSWISEKVYLLFYIYIQLCGCEYLYISPGIIKPCPNCIFQTHTPDTNINIIYEQNLV